MKTNTIPTLDILIYSTTQEDDDHISVVNIGQSITSYSCIYGVTTRAIIKAVLDRDGFTKLLGIVEVRIPRDVITHLFGEISMDGLSQFLNCALVANNEFNSDHHEIHCIGVSGS